MTNIDGMNLEGQTVILREGVMAAPYRAISERVFVCSGGFGCSPTAGGSAVFGEFVVDGERGRFRRGDVERLATKDEVAEAVAERARREGAEVPEVIEAGAFARYVGHVVPVTDETGKVIGSGRVRDADGTVEFTMDPGWTP